MTPITGTLIRHAVYSDIDQCIALMKRVHAESENYSGKINEKKLAKFLGVAVMNPYSLFLVNESGIFLASASECHYSDKIKTVNEFFYAEKEGLQFIRAYKKWGRAWGEGTEIGVGLSYGGKKGAIAQKVFIHEGFEPIGPQIMKLKVN